MQKPLPVVLVPGESFFCHTVLAATIDFKSLENFAELALEAVSPFPIDQLLWGVYKVENEDSILIYATLKERFKQKIHEWEHQASYVLPSFFAGFPQIAFEAKTIRFIKSLDSISCLVFEKGHKVPAAIKTVVVSPEDVSGIHEFYEASSKIYLNKGYAVEPGYWEVVKLSSGFKAGVVFSLKSIGREHQPQAHSEKNIFLLNQQLWAADIRSSRFKKVEIRKRLLDSVLGYGFYGALGVIFCFLIWNIILSIFSGFLTYQEKQLNEKRPFVDIALDHQRLLDHINNIYDYCLDPFIMLDILNDIRPKGLYFTQANAEDATHLDLKGVGASVDQVNEYAVALGQLSSVMSAEVVDVQTRQGKVQFTIQLVFHPLMTKSSEKNESGSGLDLPPEGSLPFDTSVPSIPTESKEPPLANALNNDQPASGKTGSVGIENNQPLNQP